MPSYLILFRFTQKGVETIKDSPSRVAAIKKEFKEKGAEVKDFFMLMGRYDTAFVATAPDDESMAKLVLSIARRGNVSTETLRAFTEEEFKKIVEGLQD